MTGPEELVHAIILDQAAILERHAARLDDAAQEIRGYIETLRDMARDLSKSPPGGPPEEETPVQ